MYTTHHLLLYSTDNNELLWGNEEDAEEFEEEGETILPMEQIRRAVKHLDVSIDNKRAMAGAIGNNYLMFHLFSF